MKSTHVDNLTLIVLWMMQSDERSLWENGKMWYYSMNWNDFMWYSNSVKCFFFFFFPCKGLKHEKKKSRSSYCNLLVCIPTSMSLHSSVHLVLVKKKKKKKSRSAGSKWSSFSYEEANCHFPIARHCLAAVSKYHLHRVKVHI